MAHAIEKIVLGSNNKPTALCLSHISRIENNMGSENFKFALKYSGPCPCLVELTHPYPIPPPPPTTHAHKHTYTRT
jgi:hypothetical protein